MEELICCFIINKTERPGNKITVISKKNFATPFVQTFLEIYYNRKEKQLTLNHQPLNLSLRQTLQSFPLELTVDFQVQHN